MPCLVVVCFNTVKMLVLPKLIYSLLNATPMIVHLFCEWVSWKGVISCSEIWERCKGHRILTVVLKIPEFYIGERGSPH